MFTVASFLRVNMCSITAYNEQLYLVHGSCVCIKYTLYCTGFIAVLLLIIVDSS